MARISASNTRTETSTGTCGLTHKLDSALDRFEDGGASLLRHHFQTTKMLALYGTAHMCGTTRFR